MPIDNVIDKIINDGCLEDEILTNEEKINLYKKIHNLDVNTREVMYLKLRGELTFKDIGNILGKTEEWARVTFYRGKIKLKEKFSYE